MDEKNNQDDTPSPQQPMFPCTNLQFGPVGGGFALQFLFSPDLVLVKTFSPGDEEQLCDLLMRRRKERREQEQAKLAVIRGLQRERQA